MSFHRYEEYKGHNNEEVKKLQRKIWDYEEKIKEAKEEIYKIQSGCNHHYQFSSMGPYEDNYVCNLCGHDTEH